MLKVFPGPTNRIARVQQVFGGPPKRLTDKELMQSVANPCWCCGALHVDDVLFKAVSGMHTNMGVTICLSNEVLTAPDSDDYKTDHFICDDGTIINFKFNTSVYVPEP